MSGSIVIPNSATRDTRSFVLSFFFLRRRYEHHIDRSLLRICSSIVQYSRFILLHLTDSNGESLFYDLDDQEDPDAVFVARANSTKPAARNCSRSTQRNRPSILKSSRQQPKPQEDTPDKHPLGSMAKFLSNPTKILVDEQGELRGFSCAENPQQKETYRKYKQKQQKKPKKTGNLQTTTAEMDFQINMTRMSQALDDYQAADPPIRFHRFDDIHVPSDHRPPLILKVGAGLLYKLLRDIGLVDGGANG